MNRFSVPALFVLILMLGGVLAAGTKARPAAAQAPEPIWAQSVVLFKAGAGTIGSNFSDPANALGPVDASIVSMGNAQTPAGPPADPAACEAVLIVSFGDYGVIDGEGDDLTIYESFVGSLLEPLWVYIGGEETGWRFVGESTGGKDGLDISGVAEPSESFSQVALCDIPDGDTTIGATPGPDIDAIAAHNTARVGLVVEASGPGWFYDPDPGQVTRDVLLPVPTLRDLDIVPPTIFRFKCPSGTEVGECVSFLIFKARCGGDVQLVNPLFAIYPSPLVSLRDLAGWHLLDNVDEYAAYCEDRSSLAAVTATEPISVFSLEEGSARYEVLEAAWRFELQTPTASLYSTGLNHFTAVHNPASGASTLRVLRGSLEVDPTAAGAGPFTLAAGQQVVVAVDGPGAVIDLAEIYLPVTME